MAIICVVVPAGFEPHLQTYYVFGQSDFRSQNDEVEHDNEANTPSSVSSSPSESKTKQLLLDPFDSGDNRNINRVNENFVIPDIIETEDHHSSTDKGSTKSSNSQPELQSESELVAQSKYMSSSEYVDNNKSDWQNINTNEPYDENDTVLGTDVQSVTSNSDTNNNTNAKVSEDVTVSAHLPNTNDNQSASSANSEPESESTSESRYKSYRDYIDNKTKNDNMIQTDDKPVTEVNSMDSQGGTFGDNVSQTSNEKVNTSEDLTSESRAADFHTNSPNGTINSNSDELVRGVTSSENQSTIESNSSTNSQPLYKSYKDFIDHNKAIKNENNDDAISTRSIDESSLTASESTTVVAQSTNRVYGDFNGDGKEDLAIGVPGEDTSPDSSADPEFRLGSAGAVNILYGSSNGLSATSPIPDQFWTQDSADVDDIAEAVDNFGGSLSEGDFNGDGFDDLAIGVPGEDLVTNEGTVSDAGAVNVLYGSSNGLSATSPHPDQFWTQNTADVDDFAEVEDQFGSSLSSGDFNGDGKDDLAIGVRLEDVDTNAGTVINAGAVNILYGSSNGLSATSPRADQFWTQATPNVDDFAEVAEFFGHSLSSGDFNGDGKDDLAIGVLGEDVDTNAGTVSDAGAVNVLYGSSNGLSATLPRTDQFWTQATPNVDDFAEFADDFGSSLSSGDFNGDGKDDLAIGIRGEDSIRGAVNILYGSSNGLSATSPRTDQFWTQATPNVDDFAEVGDFLGSSLSAGDFNGDGFDDLAIGVPGEDLVTNEGTVSFAGAVNVIYGSSNGLSATSPRTDQFWTQGTPNVDDFAEVEDQFGSSLSSGDFNGDGKDDLAIGVPFENVNTNAGTGINAGAVNVIYGSSNGLSATSPRADQFWTQETPNVDDFAEEADNFGQAVG